MVSQISVTGGAGYIGSHVCKAIKDANGNPVTFDYLSAGHAHAVKWEPIINVDLRDRAALFPSVDGTPTMKLFGTDYDTRMGHASGTTFM